MAIRLFITGGTFDKDYDEIHGRLHFQDTHIHEMLRLGRCRLDVAVRTLMMVDSLDMSEDDRRLILENCRGAAEERIVVTHGTDAMPETARVLGQAGLPKTVVLTGAMVPYAPEVAVVTRRETLRRLWRVLGLVVLAEAIASVGIYVWPRKPKPREGAYGGVVTAGPIGSFEPGSVTAFAKGQFYLVRLRDGGFLALSRRCTHLGCTVPWIEADRKFACPCHASSFDEKGEVLSAPAPRPLDLYRVSIEDGVVKVDTSVATARDRFEPSQAVKG